MFDLSKLKNQFNTNSVSNNISSFSNNIRKTVLGSLEKIYTSLNNNQPMQQSAHTQVNIEDEDQTCYINGLPTTIKECKIYKCGYITGAFDIVHDGHVRQIQKAASLCKKLYVGVSTDEVIESYKFAQPVMPYEAREKVIENIKGVTGVIPQTDLYDKLGVCKQHDIDAIFTSDEYLESTYEGKEMSEKEKMGVERWKVFQEQANEQNIDIIYLSRAISPCKGSSFIKKKIIENQPIEKGDIEVIVPPELASAPGDIDFELATNANFVLYSGPNQYSEGEYQYYSEGPNISLHENSSSLSQ